MQGAVGAEEDERARYAAVNTPEPRRGKQKSKESAPQVSRHASFEFGALG